MEVAYDCGWEIVDTGEGKVILAVGLVCEDLVLKITIL